jgi:hypothetical protein
MTKNNQVELVAALEEFEQAKKVYNEINPDPYESIRG